MPIISTLDLDNFVNFSKILNTMSHRKHISEIFWCKIIHKLKIQSSCFECGGQINKACTSAHSERQLKSRRLMSELGEASSCLWAVAEFDNIYFGFVDVC
jgi:hypothetical protein